MPKIKRAKCEKKKNDAVNKIPVKNILKIALKIL